MRVAKRPGFHGKAMLRVCVRRLPVLLLGCLLCALSLSAREQVTIQKAGTNVQLRAANAWLDQANPNANNAAGATLQVQTLTNGAQRAVVLFDLSLVPNAGVKSATLTLNVVTPPSASRTYRASMLRSFWNQPDVTWNTRVTSRAWGAAGGNFSAPQNNATVATNSTSVSWDVTQQAQSWYNGAPNYGTLIQDTNEANGTAITTWFSSLSDVTPANRPLLTIAFLQNVTGLTATPGNGQVTLNWAYPTPLGTVLENYTGVLILRRANTAVDLADAPTDLAAVPALCTAIGTSTVVFTNNANATTFTDDGTDPCGAPANGTTWFYKVFARDALGYWASNPAGLGAPLDGASTYTEEICAVPNPAGVTQTCLWMFATHAANLAAASLIPAGQVLVGTGSNLVFSVDATTGKRLYPPVSLSNAIFGRSPVIDSTDGSLAKKVIYVADQDGLVYAVDVLSGQILWVTNPGGLANNQFVGGAGVLLKKYATASYTLSNDLVIIGTRDGTTTSGNRIFALDGNTGAVRWTVTGNAGTVPPLDIMASTAAVDYVHNAIWITSYSAGGTAQPSLWKLDANTGAILFTANLGDIDSSASPSAFSDLLFVGDNAGNLYAFNAVSGAQLARFAGGDSYIYGFPFPISASSPYTVIICGRAAVQAISFNALTNTFTRLWSTALFLPSAPIFSGSKVYVGGVDGLIHEYDLITGVDGKQRAASPGTQAVVGDPAVDYTLLRIYVSMMARGDHTVAYAIPF